MRACLLISFYFLTFARSWSQSDVGLGMIGVEEKNIIYRENWFAKKYERFEPNLDVLKSVDGRMRNCKIDIIMGIWCRDTKTYLPRFLKLFDSMRIPDGHIKIYSINKSKKKPRKLIKQFQVKYLPTVIFSDDDGEIGRIVEYPYDTIEKDILKIFSDKGSN